MATVSTVVEESERERVLVLQVRNGDNNSNSNNNTTTTTTTSNTTPSPPIADDSTVRVHKLELSEADGEVFPMSFVRPPTYYAASFAANDAHTAASAPTHVSICTMNDITHTTNGDECVVLELSTSNVSSSSALSDARRRGDGGNDGGGTDGGGGGGGSSDNAAYAAAAAAGGDARTALPGIPGAVALNDILTHDECESLIACASAAGWSPTCAIGPACKGAKPPHKCVLALPPAAAARIFARLEAFIDRTLVPRGKKAVAINARCRLHRYEPGYALGQHRDRGELAGSGVDSAGELRYDVHGDGQGESAVSRASLLIFLNGHANEDCSDTESEARAFEGGHTEFVPEESVQLEAAAMRRAASGGDHAADGHGGEVSRAAVRVRPRTGAGVFFFHGEHPLSPLHAGTEVTRGEKYILRTDIIFDNDHNDDNDDTNVDCIASAKE